jgi:hypothetical protein
VALIVSLRNASSELIQARRASEGWAAALDNSLACASGLCSKLTIKARVRCNRPHPPRVDGESDGWLPTDVLRAADPIRHVRMVNKVSWLSSRVPLSQRNLLHPRDKLAGVEGGCDGCG